MNINTLITAFRPVGAQTSLAEKIRSGLAGGCAILLLSLALHFLPHPHYPLLLLASMAASSVLLFAAPHSPFSQPWNLIVGHLLSAVVGWSCAWLIADPFVAAGVAVGLAIFLMYATHSLHPPGAATALTMVLSAGQFQAMGAGWALLIVLSNAGILLLLAVPINNQLPGRQYPQAQLPAKPVLIPARIVPEQADFAWALTQMESVIDVSEADLQQIYQYAQSHATSRYEQKTRSV